jgi:tRNA (cmo5U34)-methyltransferase
MSKTNELNCVRFFDRDRVTKYDREILIRIPGYQAMHEMTHELLRMALGDQANLLIVGAGTGKEIINMGAENPQWHFTGVDPAPESITLAQQKIAASGLSDRTKLHLGFVRDLAIDTSFDAATLLLVMHFVPDDGAKLHLLQDIATRLKDGATLVLADMHGEKDSSRIRYFLAASQARQIRLGLPLNEIEAYFAQVDSVIHFIPEARILELLAATGFTQVERFYTAFQFGGWIARLDKHSVA